MSLAASLSGVLCNGALSAKRQMFGPLYESYYSDRASVIRELGIPTQVKIVVLRLNLVHLTSPKFSHAEMLTAVKVLAQDDARNLPQAIAAFEATSNLETLCAERNKWIDWFKDKSAEYSDQKIMQVYYGIPDHSNSLDERYKHFVDELYSQCDQVIFHSFELYCRLAQNLVTEAYSYRKKYSERYRFSFVDFSDRVSQGLFPPRSEFQDWLKEPEQTKKKWFQSRSAYLEEQKKAIRSNYI